MGLGEGLGREVGEIWMHGVGEFLQKWGFSFEEWKMLARSYWKIIMYSGWRDTEYVQEN